MYSNRCDKDMEKVAGQLKKIEILAMITIAAQINCWGYRALLRI